MGARQTGKSTLLKTLYPDSLYFDLLLSEEYNRFIGNEVHEVGIEYKSWANEIIRLMNLSI